MSVFISYRRDDSRHAAGRLRDRLGQAFGDDQVFFDVDDIAPGEDFRTAIRNQLREVHTTLVLIGNGWQPERLNDPDDYIRMELLEAFSSDTRVIPVLLDGAEMPIVNDVPSELHQLLYCNAAHVRGDPDFDRDLDFLVDVIGGPDAKAAVERGQLKTVEIRVALMLGWGLCVLGLFMPWIVAPGRSLAGIALNDGQVFAVLTAAWIILLHNEFFRTRTRRFAKLGLCCGGLMAALSTADLFLLFPRATGIFGFPHDAETFRNDGLLQAGFDYSTNWGLYLCVIGSLSLIYGAFLQLTTAKREVAGATSPATSSTAPDSAPWGPPSA